MYEIYEYRPDGLRSRQTTRVNGVYNYVSYEWENGQITAEMTHEYDKEKRYVRGISLIKQYNHDNDKSNIKLPSRYYLTDGLGNISAYTNKVGELYP